MMFYSNLIFQHDHMLPNLTVWETLMFVSHFTLNDDEASKEDRVSFKRYIDRVSLNT